MRLKPETAEELRKLRIYAKAMEIVAKFYQENKHFRCPQWRSKGRDTIIAEQIVYNYHETNPKECGGANLVMLFNSLFPVGAKFKFKTLPNDNRNIIELTVKKPAFLVGGFDNAPMVYVNEKTNTLFTISPDQVIYSKN